MRERTVTAAPSRPRHHDRVAPARASHPLLSLQASAGNRAVAGLLAIQRCGSAHEVCPCNSEDEAPVQRLGDGAALVSGAPPAPADFGASLPQLAGGLAALRDAESPDAETRLPSLDQRPEAPAAHRATTPRPLQAPTTATTHTPAPVRPPASALDEGPRPVLDLTGDADPARARREGEAALGELGTTTRESEQAAAVDHGENAVAHAAPPVRLARTSLAVPQVSLTAPAITPVGSDSPAMAQAESSLGGWLGDRTNSASAVLRSQEGAGRQQVDQAIADAGTTLATGSEQATTRQHVAGTRVQQDVAESRVAWTTTTRSLHDEHVASTNSRLTALGTNVAGVVQEADQDVRRQYAEAEATAKAQQNSDPSLLDRAKGALSSLGQAVRGVFDRAKRAATSRYDAAKARVAGLVDTVTQTVRAGAASVATRIRAAAASAKAAIAATVQAAEAAVRRIAGGLVDLGRRALDAAARAVRAALALVRRAARAAMVALGKAAAAVKRAIDAVARLVARLSPYEPLPAGLYAWAERWRKLAERVPGGPVTAAIGGQPALPKDQDPLATGPAGGCGVCKGSPGKAGIDVHRIIQGIFLATYGPNAFVEYPIPQKGSRTKPLSVDMARHRPDGSLAIGEIKRGNESGYTEGGESIAKYLAGIGDIDPTLKLVPMTELMPPGFVPNPEGGPECPTQKLFVNPPVGGVYGYHCLPSYEDMMRSGKCKCQKDKPPDGPPIPVPTDEKAKGTNKTKADDKEKEKDKDEAPDGGPVPDPAYAKEIYAAIILFCLAVVALLLWPEPVGKAVSAGVALLSLAAILLLIGKAGGDAPTTA